MFNTNITEKVREPFTLIRDSQHCALLSELTGRNFESKRTEQQRLCWLSDQIV